MDAGVEAGAVSDDEPALPFEEVESPFESPFEEVDSPLPERSPDLRA